MGENRDRKTRGEAKREELTEQRELCSCFPEQAKNFINSLPRDVCVACHKSGTLSKKSPVEGHRLSERIIGFPCMKHQGRFHHEIRLKFCVEDRSPGLEKCYDAFVE